MATHTHSARVLLSSQAARSEDCDCACETPHPAPLTFTQPVQWQQAKDVRVLHATLPQAWQALYHPSGPVALAVLNPAAQNLWAQHASPRPLDVSNQSAWQLAQAGFLQPHPESSAPSLPSTSRLTAWLHLTNACNLACPYCYLRKTSAHMRWETAQKAIDKLTATAAQAHYPALKLKYAGGEPLLRFPFLQRLHAYARQQAQAHGLRLESVVLSNGTLLTAPMAEYLAAHHIALAVSLDGLGEHHDRQRPYPNGRGSFQKVIENLLLAQHLGVDVIANITLTSWNLSGIPDLVRWLLQHDIPFSLNFYRDHALASEDLSLYNQQLIQTLQAVYREVENNLPRWSLLGRLTDRASLATAHSRVCSAGHDYIVIDHEGRISPCQMLIGQRAVADLHTDDILEAVRQPQPWFANPTVEEKSTCATCPWRYWCGGGCPLMTYRHTGRFDARSPFCEVYQTTIPEVLRLEALRLIKYASQPLQ